MLHQISPAAGSRKKAIRRGRGNAAGRGTTAGSGTKGQRSRSGKGRRFGFEGGQTPLLRRQPKLGGFRNPTRKEYEVVNVSILEEKLDAGTYDIAALKEKKIVSTNKPVKLLNNGEVKKKFVLTVNAASKSAKEAVEKAGGSIQIVK